MTVTICSRKEMELLLRHSLPKTAAVISFYDPPPKGLPPIDYTGKADRVFQVALHDIDFDILDMFGLSYDTYFPEAEELAEFILGAETDGLDFICQCEYGQSRSAGCAAAILEYFCKTGISVFSDYRYYPNQMVFNKVAEALKRAGESKKQIDPDGLFT